MQDNEEDSAASFDPPATEVNLENMAGESDGDTSEEEEEDVVTLHDESSDQSLPTILARAKKGLLHKSSKKRFNYDPEDEGWIKIQKLLIRVYYFFLPLIISFVIIFC